MEEEKMIVVRKAVFYNEQRTHLPPDRFCTSGLREVSCYNFNGGIEMSDYEHNVGKLIPCELKGSVEETCKLILAEMGIDNHEYCDSYREKLDDEGYRKYYITDTAIYKAEYSKKDPSDNIFRAIKNDDGTIDFETRFYNGGYSFNDAIEASIKELKL